MSAQDLHPDRCADAGAHIPRSPQAPPFPFCDLCGETASPDDYCEAAGLVICSTCLELTIEGELARESLT